ENFSKGLRRGESRALPKAEVKPRVVQQSETGQAPSLRNWVFPQPVKSCRFKAVHYLLNEVSVWQTRGHLIHGPKEQAAGSHGGLSPRLYWPFAARLKPCPTQKRFVRYLLVCCFYHQDHERIRLDFSFLPSAGHVRRYGEQLMRLGIERHGARYLLGRHRLR